MIFFLFIKKTKQTQLTTEINPKQEKNVYIIKSKKKTVSFLNVKLLITRDKELSVFCFL